MSAYNCSEEKPWRLIDFWVLTRLRDINLLSAKYDNANGTNASIILLMLQGFKFNNIFLINHLG